MSRRFVRPAFIGLASVGLLAMGAGISAATIAHKAPTTATACLDAHGGLVTPTKDACAKGLTLVHLPLSTVRGARGPAGAQGTAGTNGTNGADGATGSSGISQYQVITGGTFPIVAYTQETVTALCPASLSVLGGGVYDNSPLSTFTVDDSYPSGSNRWNADVNNDSAGSVSVTAYAICAKVNS